MKQLVLELSDNYNKIIPKTELINHKELNWGNNGIGGRWCKGIFNYTVIYSKSGKYKPYSEDDYTEVDESEIINFQRNNKGKGIIGIKVHSIRLSKTNRTINASIKKIVCKNSCVVCGSTSDIICDHKNDLYNDPRVLSTKTQTIDDFQALCNHCNLQKRQICKKEKETNKIYSAKNISQFEIYKIDFPWEKTNTKCESYWYDPIEFNRKLKMYLPYKLLILDKIQKK